MKRLGVGAIRAYRVLFAWLPTSCRFEPSCSRYTEQARGVVDLIGELLTRHPSAFAHTVLTADLLARGATEVVITGERLDLLAEYRCGWRPDAVLAWGEPTDSPLWTGREPNRAYVCREYACRVPADDAATLAGQLAGSNW